MTERYRAAPKAGKVLLAYSDPEMIRILEVNLIHANLDVVLAQNSAQVLEKIRQDKSDIVILDQELLDSENGDIYRRIKELVGEVPIILIGHRSKKQINAAKADETVIGYLPKPFDPAEVVALVRGYLAHKELTVSTTPKAKGNTPVVRVPQKWRSYLQEVDSLQVAMEISRKEARDALRNLQRLVAPLIDTAAPNLKDSLERLAGVVQELAVLGNRSLYLAADFNGRLEILQDRLTQQESEQLAASEAILAICCNIADSLQAKLLFDLESARRVASYSLAIAKELGMTDVERKALQNAALLKDIALAFSDPDIIEQITSTSHETALSLKDRLNSLWKALANIPLFVPVCNLLLYKHEMHDGTDGTFGLKGDKIPLGSRILAVADAFNLLASARPPRDETALELALKQILEQSGHAFDPKVVSVLVMLWKKNELEFTVSENKEEISRDLTS